MNRERADAGLGPLALDPEATEIAADWSRRMAEAGKISHNEAYLSQESLERLHATLLGENVASADSTDQIHAMFMDSPPHRANILQGDFRLVGVGAVRTPSGQIYLTEDFLTRETPPSAPAERSAATTPTTPAPPPRPARRATRPPARRPVPARPAAAPVPDSSPPAPTASPLADPAPAVPTEPTSDAASSPTGDAPAPRTDTGETAAPAPLELSTVSGDRDSTRDAGARRSGIPPAGLLGIPALTLLGRRRRTRR